MGKSLLKFLQPILQAKAHTEQLRHDYSNRSAAQDPARSSSVQVHEETESATEDTPKIQQRILRPGDEGSGIISVKRDPNTPWVNVIINLIDSCGKSSGQARSRLGNTAYQSASSGNGGLTKRTIGRMIDLRTIISEETQNEEKSPDDKTPEKKTVKKLRK